MFLFLDFRHKVFGLSAKNLRLVCQNCIRYVQWSFLIGQFFLQKFMSIFTVLGLWGKHSGILAQNLQKVGQNCNWCVQKISVKYWFLTKLVLFFRVLIKHFADFCQKMLSKRIILGKVPFFCGKKSFLTTEVEGEGFWCSVRTFGRFIETELFVSEWDFWLNCFFYEFFEFRPCFPTVNRTFFNIDPKTLGKLSKAHSTWTTFFLRKVCFLKKIFTFTNFSSFDEKLCEHLSVKIPPGLKNCFLHPFRGSSCITLSFFSRKLTATNGLCGKMFGTL